MGQWELCHWSPQLRILLCCCALHDEQGMAPNDRHNCPCRQLVWRQLDCIFILLRIQGDCASRWVAGSMNRSERHARRERRKMHAAHRVV